MRSEGAHNKCFDSKNIYIIERKAKNGERKKSEEELIGTQLCMKTFFLTD